VHHATRHSFGLVGDAPRATALLPPRAIARPRRGAAPLLLKQSEAAAAKIKSYSFTVETEYENVVRNRPATKSTGEIKRRGQHLFAFNKSSVQGPFGPMEQPRRRERRIRRLLAAR
jgi:hypothetical protein